MAALVKDLKIARTDEIFNDVCLTGVDGGSIQASRTILSMRSQFFKRMFFGDFRESHLVNVPLLFRSSTLEHIVQYCYSDEVGADSNDARGMVRLRSAADFFGLPNLHYATTDRLVSLVVAKPGLACTVLDELSALGEAGGKFSEIVLGVIQALGRAALLPDGELGICACSPSVLATILSEEVVGTNDALIVSCLRRWETRKHEDEETPELVVVGEDHRTIGREISSRVRLSSIAPSALADLLRSDLFNRDQVYEAFKEYALLAEEKVKKPQVVPFPFGSRSTASIGGRCIVKGAGVQEANGMYTQCSNSLSDGEPYYHSKGGTYKGNPVTFQLYRITHDGTTNKWILAASLNDGSQHLCLYTASCLDAFDVDKVPRHGWQPMGGEVVGIAAGQAPLVLEIGN
jgi:hypothetical protein